MFKNLRTGTKLFTLCTAFVISAGVPVGALVMEKRIAIDSARKELVGSRNATNLVPARIFGTETVILGFLHRRGDGLEPLLRPDDVPVRQSRDAKADAGGNRYGTRTCWTRCSERSSSIAPAARSGDQ